MNSNPTFAAFFFALCVAAEGASQEVVPTPTPVGPILELPGVEKLTIRGQYRIRGEGFYNYDFTDNAGTNEDFISHRARLSFDFTATEDVTVMMELQDVRLFGEELSTTDASADAFDLHQGYVEVRNVLGTEHSFKAGRQRVSYGDQRIIGGLDWLQQARAFDGFTVGWNLEDGWVDTFAYQIRERFNNGIDDDQYFGGIYSHFNLSDEVWVEPYLLFLHDDGLTPGGTQNRATLGTLWKYNHDGLTLGAEVATQFGEQGNADIPFGETLAANVHGRLTTTINETETWVGFDVNYASGNDPNSSDNERFNNLFPTAHKFWGFADFATLSNLLHASASAGFATGEDSDLTAWVHFFRSDEEADAVRGPRGTLTNGVVGGSNSLGTEIDVIYRQTLNLGGKIRSHVHLGYSIFLPGRGVEDSFGDDDVAHFAYIETNFSF